MTRVQELFEEYERHGDIRWLAKAVEELIGQIEGSFEERRIAEVQRALNLGSKVMRRIANDLNSLETKKNYLNFGRTDARCPQILATLTCSDISSYMQLQMLQDSYTEMFERCLKVNREGNEKTS